MRNEKLEMIKGMRSVFLTYSHSFFSCSDRDIQWELAKVISVKFCSKATKGCLTGSFFEMIIIDDHLF